MMITMRKADLVCIAILIALGSLMLWPAACGHRPVSSDHTVHYFKAWQLKEQLLTTPMIWRWSHKWFAGYPANAMYPIVTDVWVIAVYALSLGSLTFSQAYGVAFWLFFLFHGFSVYLLGRKGWGPGVGLTAAILYMTDTGAIFSGGWSWIVNYGVWPIALSMSFSTLAIAELIAFLSADAIPRRLAKFSFFAGLALLAHPAQLVNIPILLLAVALAHASLADWSHCVRSIRKVAYGLITAALIASFWLVPFLSSAPYASKLGIPWHSLGTMARLIDDGIFLSNAWSFANTCGFLGACFLLWSKNIYHRTIAVTIFLFLILGSSSFYKILGLTAAMPALRHIEFVRFAMLLKPFWFTAAAAALWGAGYGILHLSQALDQGPRKVMTGAGVDGATPRLHFATLLIVILCLAPTVGLIAQHFFAERVLRNTVYNVDDETRADREALATWIRAVHASDARFFRVAHSLQRWRDHTRLIDLGTELPVPLYKGSFKTAASTFKYAPSSISEAMLRALNVRFVIADQPLTRPDLEFHGAFGEFLVYAFRHWNPEPFEVVDGKGPVELLSFQDEVITLRAGPEATGRLRLNVTYFPHWRAERDGKPIPISTSQVEANPATAFMTVDLKPGLYRFEYQHGWEDWLGYILAPLGLLICIWWYRPRIRMRTPTRAD